MKSIFSLIPLAIVSFCFATNQEVIELPPLKVNIFSSAHLTAEQHQKVAQFSEGEIELNELVYNGFVTFDAQYPGYVPLFPRKIAERLKEQDIDSLLSHLKDSDRYIAAHVFLCFVTDQDFGHYSFCVGKEPEAVENFWTEKLNAQQVAAGNDR